MIQGLNNVSKTINEDCISRFNNLDAQKCKAYIQEKLDLGKDLSIDNLKTPWLLGASIALKYNKLSSSLKDLSNETFWLNAPEECGIGKDLKI